MRVHTSNPSPESLISGNYSLLFVLAYLTSLSQTVQEIRLWVQEGADGTAGSKLVWLPFITCGQASCVSQVSKQGSTDWQAKQTQTYWRMLSGRSSRVRAPPCLGLSMYSTILWQGR
eukprot:1157304-Pelagomonas_calceolata.AAC.6